jgi:hypothetical protein
MEDGMNILVAGKHHSTITIQTSDLPLVRGATSMAKRYLYSYPDPFAVLSIDDDQSHTTKTVKKTLNPSWDETFDV